MIFNIMIHFQLFFPFQICDFLKLASQFVSCYTISGV